MRREILKYEAARDINFEYKLTMQKIMNLTKMISIKDVKLEPVVYTPIQDKDV